MAGSEAEERLRAKVIDSLRREFPSARIIHELNMQWGGIRLDVAAVRPDGLTLVEIKSERDVLKRLPAQIEAALRITGDVRVYAAAKHRKALQLALEPNEKDEDGRDRIVWTEGKHGSLRGDGVPNGAFIEDLRRCRVLVEDDAGPGWSVLDDWGWHDRERLKHVADPMALLELLWAEELSGLLGSAGIGAPLRANRELKKRLAVEDMALRKIRQGVCAALRERPFHRADERAVA